ncbi:hypothetical protein HPB48_002068 [Haemaphysalis longicornis]|uniref:Anaphylatoxin-like domain-containing protein n=1 Tax=Haemaphysalis longicornis TaxID=44386 RepID=A0A9J6FG57_HAELO|nr:hypothetical protein HPB48_002068 [Haemaphysalis longicornis]
MSPGVFFPFVVRRGDCPPFAQVLSKGRVQLAKRLTDDRVIERSIEFTVTPEMTPTFRIVVFARLGGRLVADSVHVNAEPACTASSNPRSALRQARECSRANNQSFAVEEYQDKTLRKCCSKGQMRDPFLRTCDDRVSILREYVEGGSTDISQDCVDAFARCCYDAEGPPTDFLDLFRENGITEWKFSMPASITTWAVSAVSVSPRGGVCVVTPMEIVSSKKFFVEVNLPYSVVKKEQIEIPVTVYNYGRESVQAKVALIGTANICSGSKLGKPSLVRSLDIPAGRGRTATFPVVPLASGEQEIQVVAKSRLGTDGVKVKLNVENPGVERQRHFTVPLDPASTKGQSKRDIRQDYTVMYSENGTQLLNIRRPSPDFLVEHSQHCEIDIVGDAVGAALETAVKDPGRAIIQPGDCGEQTMAKWAPALYAYDYMKAANRIKADDEDRVLQYIREGNPIRSIFV